MGALTLAIPLKQRGRRLRLLLAYNLGRVLSYAATGLLIGTTVDEREEVERNLRATQRLSLMCETFGLGLSMHSNSHLGISLLAMTHLAACVPNLSYACDTHYPWQEEEVIVGGRVPIEGGGNRRNGCAP